MARSSVPRIRVAARVAIDPDMCLRNEKFFLKECKGYICERGQEFC